MRFDCDARKKRREARDEIIRARLSMWHPHFAWLPVRLSGNDCRWLETIERRLVFYSFGSYGWGHTVEYRAKEPS